MSLFQANLANKTRPTNQNRAGLRPRVQPGKAKTTFKSAKAPQGKLESPAKKLTNQNKGKAISQALALKRLNKVMTHYDVIVLMTSLFLGSGNTSKGGKGCR